jgi:hypothetical protein
MKPPDSFTMHGVTFRKVRDDGPNSATYQAESPLGEEAARAVERANLERAANELQRLATHAVTPSTTNLRRAVEFAGSAIMALRGHG